MSYVNSGLDALACSALAAMLGSCEPLRRNAMSANQKPAGSSDDAGDSDEFRDGQVSRVPDEDGPHDVPDEKVIDKTLPTKPVSDSGGSGPP
jgi:hypothetical protein